jgi:YihY family inner membrane protein
MPKLRGILKHSSYYISHLNKSIADNHVFLLASGLSFSVLTCIIPFVLILFSILGTILSRPQIENEISIYIDRMIPYPEEADFVKNLILERVDDFTVYGTLAGVIGVFGMIFMSSGLFGSLRTILNRVYKVVRERPVWTGNLKDVGLLLLVIFYFLVSVAILPTSEALLETAQKVEFLSFLKIGAVTNVLVATTSFVIAFVSFYIVYWLLPQNKLPQKVIQLSAITAAILWQFANQLFGFYIGHALTLKNVYGAYSLIVVVAIWIYYTSIVFIIGAAVGQAYRERHYEHIH